MASSVSNIKIPASSLFGYELYCTVKYIKRANMFITKHVLRNSNVNIIIYEH
jgi:hypothetical protein